jgi:hypothetical protein
MFTNQRVICVNAADRAAFLEKVEISTEVGDLATPPWLLWDVTTAVGEFRSGLHLIRFVANGGIDISTFMPGGSKLGIKVVEGTDPRLQAVKWMLHNGYADPSMGRALDLMEPDKLAFYGKDGNAVSLERVSNRLGDITHVCLRNSDDGKTSIFAVTDVKILQKVMRQRSGGNKVTYAFLRGDSPEVSNSEVSAQDNTRQKFIQALTGSFLTTGISSLVTLLSILLSTFVTGATVSLPAMLVAVITFIIFTTLGLFAYAMA